LVVFRIGDTIVKVHIDILTLFPRMFEGPLDEGMVKRACDRGVVSISIHNIRDYAQDKHFTVDDRPYGGGRGMILKVEPLCRAIEDVKSKTKDSFVVLLSPQGRPLSMDLARELSRKQNLIFICGHYEGVDERVRENLVHDEISIGDYILSGGELPAIVVIDVVTRFLMLDKEVVEKDSYALGVLEYPQYTRPSVYQGWEVPPVLLSGNHQEIARWRMEQAMRRTQNLRPAILEKVEEYG
jgi:tRNA (guanine37-N1)-methyltransferase